jgi:hypothetical protein
MSTVNPPQDPQVIYVKASGNGYAVGALVAAIIGLAFGLIPILFPAALAGGIVALALGFVGLRKANRDPMAGHRKMAIIALLLGAGALALSIADIAIINHAVSQLNNSLNQIQPAN